MPVVNNPQSSQAPQSSPVPSFPQSNQRSHIVSGASQQYEYLSVYFVGHINSGLFSSQGHKEIENQLTQTINQYASQGWEYCHISQVSTFVSNSCLASFLGKRDTQITNNMIIFRRLI